MTNEPGKHAHRGTAPPVVPPPSRVSNLPGVPVLAALVAGMLTVAVVLWFVWAPWSDDDEEPRTPSTPGPAATTFGADWSTTDGGHYRITVTPSPRSSVTASSGGCVPTATEGRLNARFTVRIDNLGDAKAPVPVVGFGANLGAKGTVRPAALGLDRSSRAVELAPRAPDTNCTDAADLGPAGRDPLAAGGSADYRGTFGPVRPGTTGTAVGLTLIVRYQAADPADLERSVDQEFVVPFALEPVD